MMKLIGNINRFTLFYFCGLSFFLISQTSIYAQQGPYSNMALSILDQNNSEAVSSNLDIFKFSINDILNSSGIPLENANGDSEIFGRTDFGSEFVLANDLSTTSEIQIPAFVIDVLAEDETGEYLPIIVNGFSDEEDGNYIRSYTNEELNAYVQETFNSDGPNVVSYQYDNRTEIQYLPDEGVSVTKNLFTDGGHSKNYVKDSLRVYTETNSNGYSFTNYHDDGRENPIFAIDYNYEDGSSAFEINENGERYFQRSNSDNTSEFRYSEDRLEIGRTVQVNGNTTKFVTKTDDAGNTQTLRQIVIPNGAITVEYDTPQYGVTTYVRNEPVTNQDGTLSYTYSGDENHIITEIVTENGDSSFFIDGETFIENIGEVVSITDRVASKNALTEQLQILVTEGDDTITLSENFNNFNSRSIDFKDLYDNINGQTITPEMGYVRLNSGDGNEYVNLSNGDIIEFFVRPTDTYQENHNAEDLFFIDRPVPENPVAIETDTSGTEYTSSDSGSSETEESIYAGPGEEAITLPSGEIKVYVTTVYVPAPASNFLPSQVVMPIKADGDYNYDIEPAAAKTFPDEVEVVAIPEEEAEVLSEKVKAIKKEKASSSKAKEDDLPPVMATELEPIVALNTFLNNVQKAPNKLLSETKKTIQKEFPNMSGELIDLIINMANSDEKFDILKDPKAFLDRELSMVSKPQDLNSILSADLSQKELTKIYNFIIYKFSSELANLGFGTLKNQEINFIDNLISADQILEQIQLQTDIKATLPLLGSNGSNQALSNLLIKPVEIDPDSSTALFQSSQSQKVLNQIKRFSNVINSINNLSITINTTEGLIDDEIPVIEVNVGVGENIAKALEEKLAEDKRLKTRFQTRTLNSKLQKYDFELPTQEENSAPPESPPLLAEAPDIPDQQLQLVAEITEATNNILDDTINKMLTELGDNPTDTTSIQLISAANNLEQPDPKISATREDAVFENALLSTQKLQQVEDIRAIFQILGLGS